MISDRALLKIMAEMREYVAEHPGATFLDLTTDFEEKHPELAERVTTWELLGMIPATAFGRSYPRRGKRL